MSDHLILIPVFNEAATIGEVVARARRHGAVLMVDDGSTDGGAAAAEAAGADVLTLGRRHGKGEALRRGLEEGKRRGIRRVVALDGDGQHDPDDLPRLLAAAEEAPNAIVIGGRLGAAAGVIPPSRLAALRVAGFFINWLTGTPVADTQSGFRVYPTALLDAVAPRRGGFVFETEMLVRAAAAGWRLLEVPVRAIHFEERRSRFRPVRDGVAVGAYLAGHILRRWAADGAAAARAVAGPFTAAQRRPRHREFLEFAASYRHNPGAWAAAAGAFTLHRTAETWRGWWSDPRLGAARLAAVATAATPALLGLALLSRPLGWLGLDPLTPFVRSVYSQDRLAAVLPRADRPAGRVSAGMVRRAP